MFMSINSKENWVNGEATKQIRNRKEGTSKERANEQQDEKTDSRMTELTIERSTKCSPVEANERTKNRENEFAKLDEQLNNRVDSSFG